MKNMVTGDGQFFSVGHELVNKIAAGMKNWKGVIFDAADSIAAGIKNRMKITGKVSVTGTGLQSIASIDWYDKGGLFKAPQIIGIAEKRPEFEMCIRDSHYYYHHIFL